ncbi:hypothetical protein Plec18167_004541 [Paecilomyces lecythidis]|uniref:C2H2-type domain-containing protein n=1 Tax=Paecilomyces lecythidis TaxID=3004212 RepID=A0ABR3XSA1_9EURO
MTPMDRWRASPPEDEPASESAIRNAIASTRLETSSGDDALFPIDGSVEDLFDFEEASSHLPSSASSFGSRASETSDSISSAWSHHSTGDGGLPFPLLPKRTRKRRSRDDQQHSGQMGRYQCTFCVRTFKKKHDWSRHEKSIHLALDSWICTPDLTCIQQLMKPESLECSFCESPFPTTGHWDEHDFHVCATKPVSERSFSRRDHLWQHLRKFHGCTKPPVSDLDVWRGTGANVHSRCGFCGDSLSTWTARVDHLAAHFKKGCHMGQWDGDWGLDPSALSMLRNAVLPSERPSG